MGQNRGLLLPDEVEAHAVDAVALPRGLGPVIEHMAEVCAASAAGHFGAHHAPAAVLVVVQGILSQGLEEARPAAVVC